MYLTYEEYTNMGGTLEETAFENYEFEARSLIDWYTFHRLDNEETYPEAVKRCMYALIQLAELKASALKLGMQPQESSSSTSVEGLPYVASQSNDGVSISYNVLSASEMFKLLNSKEAGNVVEDTIKRYLNGVKNSLGRLLLFRGFYPNE